MLFSHQVIKIYKNPDENPLKRGASGRSLGRPFIQSFPETEENQRVAEENKQLRREVEAVRFVSVHGLQVLSDFLALEIVSYAAVITVVAQ